MTTLRASPIQQYSLITLSYWAFTLTDGALRMLVVLFFHSLGFSPLEIAGLFLLYEFFGVVTNLIGGWLAAAIGLNITLQVGLGLQVAALAMLAIDSSLLTVSYVMLSQALSGIAKDLNKMSAKTSIKALVPDAEQSRLYRWIALLTGSKNALKGLGFFLGGWLLAATSFQTAVMAMASMLASVLLLNLVFLQKSPAAIKWGNPLKQLFSSSDAVNRLSAARFCLFASRDIWFVVALPVFLQEELGWTYLQVGTLLATWVMVYGAIQTLTPKITGWVHQLAGQAGSANPSGKAAFVGSGVLCLLPALIVIALYLGLDATQTIVAGLFIFGVVFAVNSSVHSYLIVAYARAEGASLDIGFYYMANAGGRLVATLLSGLIYQVYGLTACLLGSSLFLVGTVLISARLPRERQ